MTDDQALRDIALQRAIEFAAKAPGSVDVIELAERICGFLVGGAREVTPARRKNWHRWTAAGKDALRRLWPTEPELKNVLTAVREIEGVPDLSANTIQVVASRMGLRRPAECMSPGVRAILAAKRASAAS